jgi:hypothetical protein
VSESHESRGPRRVIAAAGLLALTLGTSGCGGLSHHGSPDPSAALCTALHSFTRNTSPHEAAATLSKVPPPTNMGSGGRNGLRLIISGLARLPDTGARIDLRGVEKGLGPQDRSDVVHFLHYVQFFCLGSPTGSGG